MPPEAAPLPFLRRATNPLTGSSLADLLDGVIRGVRTFFADIGQLLTAADGAMTDRGSEPLGDSGCLFWTSASLSRATHWVPRVAARQYACPKRAPNVTAVVSVLIDDTDMEYRLAEPVVAAAYFVRADDAGDRDGVPVAVWGGR